MVKIMTLKMMLTKMMVMLINLLGKHLLSASQVLFQHPMLIGMMMMMLLLMMMMMMIMVMMIKMCLCSAISTCTAAK